jgi:hypothetical protein
MQQKKDEQVYRGDDDLQDEDGEAMINIFPSLSPLR